jgi:ribosome-associated heat shock protein Hsp15
MDSQRLDKYLWCARFVSQREACQRLAETGLVRINGQRTDKAHAKVRVGDILTVPLPAGVRVVRVRTLAARRGPAAEAYTLYEELPAP